MKLSNNTKKTFKKRMIYLYEHYNLSEVEYDELRSVRDSYLGHLSYGDCGSLIDRYILFKKILKANNYLIFWK